MESYGYRCIIFPSLVLLIIVNYRGMHIMLIVCCIGYSCKLFTQSMVLLIINETDIDVSILHMLDNLYAVLLFTVTESKYKSLCVCMCVCACMCVCSFTWYPFVA